MQWHDGVAEAQLTSEGKGKQVHAPRVCGERTIDASGMEQTNWKADSPALLLKDGRERQGHNGARRLGDSRESEVTSCFL